MKILIIEDEEKLALSLKEGLEDMKNTVDYLIDGLEGLKRIEIAHEDYDVLILDWMLPGINGMEICKKMRHYDINLPVLMLTAKDSIENKISGLNGGADDYLTKPFSFDELIARLNALSRRPRIIIPKTIKINDIYLDIIQKEVKLKDELLDLTIKEFEILEYLMTHAGRNLSRDQIISHVWGYDYDPVGNVVDTHIKNLRRKLKNEEIIQTIRGIGFQFKK